jgi:hypothetical protein
MEKIHNAFYVSRLDLIAYLRILFKNKAPIHPYSYEKHWPRWEMRLHGRHSHKRGLPLPSRYRFPHSAGYAGIDLWLEVPWVERGVQALHLPVELYKRRDIAGASYFYADLHFFTFGCCDRAGPCATCGLILMHCWYEPKK